MRGRIPGWSLLAGLGCLLSAGSAGAVDATKPAFVFTGIPD